VGKLEGVVVALAERWECKENDGEKDDENDPCEDDDGECVRLVLYERPADSLKLAGQLVR
jgi:hypothetical protein